MPSFDSFLLGLYGCCTDPTRWRPTLDQLCTELDATSVVLQCVDTSGPQATPFFMTHDSKIDIGAYQAKISDASNPRLQSHRVIEAQSGGLQTDEELFAPDEAPLRARLQAQLRDVGLGRFIGGMFALGPNRYLTVAAHRAPGDASDFSSRQRERLAAVLPHAAQAVMLSGHGSRSHSTSALLQNYLEEWPRAMMVCDAQGHIHWINQRGRTQLQLRHPGELRLCDALLRGASAGAQQRLMRELQQVLEDGRHAYQVIETAIGRLQVVIQRLERGPQVSVNELLLVSLADEQCTSHIPVEALRSLFNLTEAEARLASALVAGTTVEQYAQHRGVTVGTARYQLNQVLIKTGAHRQADLVRRVLCSAAAHLMHPLDEPLVTH